MNHTCYDERKEDSPIYSRLFVVCSRQTEEHELREVFQKFGTIEDLFMPRFPSGVPKGIAFIKYNKTSEAAAAIKGLNNSPLGHTSKLKITVAFHNKNEPRGQCSEKYTRLFIKVAKDTNENDLQNHFSNFGAVQSVFIMRDKATGESKGFAYVKFEEFYEAAKAFEECDRKYRPIFADPKELKGTQNISESDNIVKQSNNFEYKSHFQPSNVDGLDNKTVTVICSPILPEKFIFQLMNIIPGIIKFQYSADTYNGLCKTQVTYGDAKFATFAIERINNYQFPSGEIVTVKKDTNVLHNVANELTHMINNFKNAAESGTDLMNLADAIEKASSLIKAATQGQLESKDVCTVGYCSVPLPPLKPVTVNARTIKRLFIICKPEPPPLHVLQDAFCRFGNCIGVSTIPNKTFGFVKYASNSAAMEAMRVLNGASLCGARLKVLEADERPSVTDTSVNAEHSLNSGNDPKRMKYNVT